MAYPGDRARKYVPSSTDSQIQPAGIDLRISIIEEFTDKGVIMVNGKDIPRGKRLEPQGGYWELKPGAYRIRFEDIVEIPLDAVGLCFPRSSLLRMGATINCAVWDPGYRGRGQALLNVFNPHGIRIEVGARIAQIIFIKLLEYAKVGYSGSYLGEGL